MRTNLGLIDLIFQQALFETHTVQVRCPFKDYGHAQISLEVNRYSGGKSAMNCNNYFGCYHVRLHCVEVKREERRSSCTLAMSSDRLAATFQPCRRSLDLAKFWTNRTTHINIVRKGLTINSRSCSSCYFVQMIS